MTKILSDGWDWNAKGMDNANIYNFRGISLYEYMQTFSVVHDAIILLFDAILSYNDAITRTYDAIQISSPGSSSRESSSWGSCNGSRGTRL